MESMRIPLTRGQTATIDAADYEIVAHLKWCALKIRDNWYAVHSASRRAGGQRTVYMHRLITGAPRGTEVDHENGDTLDNRRRNLRIATRSQNAANTRRNSRNTSGLIGVSWDSSRGKWSAYVKANGKRRFVGRFDSLEAAGRARDVAARTLHGSFAYQNFPD